MVPSNRQDLRINFWDKNDGNGEKGAQANYAKLFKDFPETENIIKDEAGHEKALINILREEKLLYIGSIVLGMNDALVELTGTLAGLTFALQNGKLVGIAGLITGIAAALSMSASEYLSTRAEEGGKNPLRSAFYTGITYFAVVFFLIVPFLVYGNPFVDLGISILAAIIMIFLFTFYFSVVKDVSFKKRFSEMLVISLGVATLSFVIGLIVRFFLGINV